MLTKERAAYSVPMATGKSGELRPFPDPAHFMIRSARIAVDAFDRAIAGTTADSSHFSCSASKWCV